MGSTKTERERMPEKERASLYGRVTRYIRHGMRLAEIERATGLDQERIKKIAASAQLTITKARTYL